MHLSIASSLALLLTLVSAEDTASIITSSSPEIPTTTPTPAAAAAPYLDPALWSPIATITHAINTAPASQTKLPAAILRAAYENNALPEEEQLELREIVADVGATEASEQTSPITTIWLNGVEVIYTQLFSAVPDQWSSAKSGAIGYGTLNTADTSAATSADSKNKRAEATAVEEVEAKVTARSEPVSEYGEVMSKRDESSATSIVGELFVTGLGMGVGLCAGVGIFLAI